MGRQRVAGATVEEPIFDDINAWQAQVWKKPPLEEPITWQGQRLGGGNRPWEGNAWQELLWKNPFLMTSTRGRRRFGRNHP